MVVDVVDVDDDADNLEVPQWTHEHVEHDAATCRSRLADLLAINRPSCPDQPINQSINQSINLLLQGSRRLDYAVTRK